MAAEGGEAKPEVKKSFYDTLPASLKTDLLVRFDFIPFRGKSLVTNL